MTARRVANAAWFEATEFTLDHLALYRAIAGELAAAGALVDAALWTSLAERIEKVLVGEWAHFTAQDLPLVGAMHKATARRLDVDDARARSRMLAGLSLLVYHAARGRLAQLQRGGLTR
jgi:hypothetical protein